MRRQKQGFAFYLFLGWTVAIGPLHAMPIVWQLVGVTFSDGATASGTFTYDDATLDHYSAWNIFVTPGIFDAYEYQLGVDNGFLGDRTANQVDFLAFPSVAPHGRYVHLTFSSPLTSAGGTALLRTENSNNDNSSWECNNCDTLRYITGGAVTSVPEPSNLTLVPAALAVGVLRRLGLRGYRNWSKWFH